MTGKRIGSVAGRRIVAVTVALFGLTFATAWSPSPSLADPGENAVVANAPSQNSISIGDTHVCAVADDGGVKCWGNNWAGQSGSPASNVHIATPTDVTGMSNATHVAVGQSHSCTLDDQGVVSCWGLNNSGQLGRGDTTNGHAAVSVSGLTAVATSIGTGTDHSCAVLDPGELACWGSGTNGAIGQNVATRNTPGIVPGLTNDFVAVSGGANFTCALRTNGSVTCFGKNNTGQSGATPQSSQECAYYSGDTCYYYETTYADAPPSTVSGFGSATASAISVGSAHACAALSDGTVACWGSNTIGQLGVSGGSNHVATVVPGVSNAIAVTAGDTHSCALLSNGTAMCWGSNTEGQLGDGTFADRSSAATVPGLSSAVAITAGPRVTCAVLTTGVVQCWGDNTSQQLGRGSSTTVLTPTSVSLPSAATQIYGGGRHHCALLGDTKLMCWGSNSFNQISASGDATHPVPTLISGLVSGSVTISSVALGYAHTCVGLSDGTVKCWGLNTMGQLGRGDFISNGVPESPAGLESPWVTKVFAHANNTCVITADGDALCWGSNFHGQLGLGTTGNNVNLPTTVSALSGVDVADIAVGNRHICFAYTPSAGSGLGVKCSGDNGLGQLGNGTNTASSSPVQVSGVDQDVSSIVAGMYHTCALKIDGSVVCWGGNNAGEAGIGTTVNVWSPASVSSLSGVVKLAVGDRHTCAVLNTGAACWGTNNSGAVGNQSVVTPVTLPTTVTGLSDAITAMSGTGEDMQGASTCVLVSGAVSCWGSDSHGQAGQGYVPNSSTPGAVAGNLLVALPEASNPTPPNNSIQAPPPVVVLPPSTTASPTTTTPPAERSAQPSVEMISLLPSSDVAAPGVVFPGQSVTVAHAGFTPGSTVDVYVASTPQLVGSATADENGRVELTVTIPSGLVGQHSLVLYEPSTGKAVRQAITIEPLTLPLTLPLTGSSERTTDFVVSLAVVLLVLGVLGENTVRRRRLVRRCVDPRCPAYERSSQLRRWDLSGQ